MIIKNKDNNQDSIDYLTDLLDRDFSDGKKSLIEREISSLESISSDVNTASYFLNTELGGSKNWALIHDLRIEHEGELAHIDHLLISRMMDVYIINSENFGYDISISEEGEFSYLYNNEAYAMPSSLQQNQQNLKILERFLMDRALLPKRLGITLDPVYRNIVVVSPGSKLNKPTKGLYDCSAVMKVDKFLERFKHNAESSFDATASLAKLISHDSLQRLAEKIVLHHTQYVADYIEKFSLRDEKNKLSASSPLLALPSCPVCGKEMVQREAKKGKNAGKVFFGCSQFPKCRGVLELDSTTNEEKEEALPIEKTPECPTCHGPMVKRISKSGKSIGREFWGCQGFPKCRGVVSIDKE